MCEFVLKKLDRNSVVYGIIHKQFKKYYTR